MNFRKTIESISEFLGSQQYVLLPLLLVITLLLTIVLYPDLVSHEKEYLIGDIVDRDIKAPADFYIKDKPATENNRKQASDSVLTVYDYDTDFVNHLINKVNEAFQIPRDIIEKHNADIKARDELISQKEDKTESTGDEKPLVSLTESVSTKTEISVKDIKIEPLGDKLQQVKTVFKDKIGIPVNDASFNLLKKNKFSTETAGQIATVLKTIMDNGVVANKDILLSESEKGVTLRTMSSDSSDQYNEVIETGLKKIYGLPQSKLMVRIKCQELYTEISSSEKNLIVDFVQRLINPNITLNIKETERRRVVASEETKPVLYKIKSGEMILREGERVTESHIIKLNEISVIQKKSNYYLNSSGTALVVLLFLIVTYTLHFKSQYLMNQMQNKNIFFISCILILLLLVAKLSSPFAYRLTPNLPFSVSESSFFFGIPLATGSMIVCIFLGLQIAIPFSLVLSVFTALIFNNNFEVFVFFVLSSSMAAYWMQNCRERKVFIKAGLKLAILNVLIAISINVYMAEMLGSKILTDSLFAFSGGLLAGIITAGLTPVVEVVFGFTTDIKLLELANLGFDWDNMEGVLEKVEEEWNEFKEALVTGNKKDISLEFGDILFTLTNVARFAGIHPETALAGSVAKFEHRYRYMEKKLQKDNKKLDSITREEIDLRWDEAKAKT